MHIPVPERTIPRLHVSDKTLHFAVYFGLTLLSGLALRARHQRRQRAAGFSPRGAPDADPTPTDETGPRERRTRLSYRLSLLLWAAIYVLYGAFDEWSQQFVHRSTSLADWYADVLGILTATVLLIAWSLLRAPSESHQP